MVVPQIVLKMEILRSQNFSLRNSEKVFGTLPSTGKNYDLVYVSISKTFKIVHQKLEIFLMFSLDSCERIIIGIIFPPQNIHLILGDVWPFVAKINSKTLLPDLSEVA